MNLFTKIRERSAEPSSSEPDQSSPAHYNRLLSGSITDTLAMVHTIIRGDPVLARRLIRTIRFQKRADALRRRNELEGVQVPAVIILSMTKRCNLSCAGCYMQAQHRDDSPEMNLDQLKNLVSQAIDLGVSFMVLAGGEPLIRSDEILTLASEFPDMIFALFTNGVFISEEMAASFSRRRNIVPILSIEGSEEETDSRRTDGVFRSVMHAFSFLRKNRIFFGCSITVTECNFSLVTGEPFIRDLLNSGCRLITYVEYVPIEPGTDALVMNSLKRKNLNELVSRYSSKFPALFLVFPGDEEYFGGCLSAGRGFVHISPSGDLEPCPAAPFSDVNISKIPLKIALRSEFLTRIREQHTVLSEAEGGCALWKRRDFVRSLLNNKTH